MIDEPFFTNDTNDENNSYINRSNSTLIKHTSTRDNIHSDAQLARHDKTTTVTRPIRMIKFYEDMNGMHLGENIRFVSHFWLINELFDVHGFNLSWAD